ncbi:beta-galactosidase [Psychrosphaera sp. 1_MG-2023]|uniref:beta-galactosidase n=1 Tax=Psychrosphaera sp. 1_MG-2023 TaxID=3062643 RepID=UPI0026E42E27|nr:beta-galactosidase [Psychrosphaera sp. 1_MG-2023]MDO6719435.1 beta-galactosidase [Psychrosphaera sp. 1_MG-2023]
MRIITLAALSTVMLLSGCSNKQNQSTNTDSSYLTQLVDIQSDKTLPKEVKLNAADAYVSDDGAIVVNFHSGKHSYSSIVFESEQGWDWSDFKDFNLAFDIANSGQHSTQIYLDITDGNGDNYTRSVSIPIGPTKTYYAKMAGHDLATPDGDEKVELNFTSGLRSNPDTWASNETQFISLWGKKNLDTSKIKRISLSVQSALFDKTITISNIGLRTNPKFDEQFLTGIVDQFGQNAKVEFAGKIHDIDELKAARDQEMSELRNNYDPATRSKFGGWKNGPRQAATGYFRTQKIGDKWSLVDPEGYPYFATGLDIIRLSNTSTMTGYDFDQSKIVQRKAGDLTPEDSQKLNRVGAEAIPTRKVASDVRKQMFNWLPSYDEPLGKHYGYRRSAHSGPLKHGETFSFYSANLERKYSDINPDFMQVWQDVTIRRMQTWGFTSFGNWTDPMFYQNNRVPYFANGWIIGNYKTVSSGNDFWAPLPDVFDPLFEERANITLAKVAEEVRNNPWCVGVFIDNEMSLGRPDSLASQYGIALHTLQRDGNDVPTKAEFTRLMKQKYGTIEKLNTSWGTDVASWKSFNKGIKGDITIPNQVADFSIMLHAYANQYFSVVSKAKDKHMPNHLYMGARFPDWGMPKEAVMASAKHVDVISFNVYKEGLTKSKWKFLEKLDMPAIVGEWHNGASDSGLFHPGLIHASSQEDRGVMYKDYMHSVIDHPNFIGAHWFQYMDSPITGRAYDGENYNVGFINVADTPYKPIVKAATEINEIMYERRFNQ